jgi:hypothetical protein
MNKAITNINAAKAAFAVFTKERCVGVRVNNRLVSDVLIEDIHAIAEVGEAAYNAGIPDLGIYAACALEAADMINNLINRDVISEELTEDERKLAIIRISAANLFARKMASEIAEAAKG